MIQLTTGQTLALHRCGTNKQCGT